MKPITAGGATEAYCLRITRTDGAVYAYTAHDRDLTIDGITYDASQGVSISSIASSADAAVDNLELTTLDDGTLFTTADIAARRWSNAAFLIFKIDWSNPDTSTLEPELAGTLGEVTVRGTTVVAELRSLKQYLQQSLGNVSSKTCRARFADYPSVFAGNRCRLAAASYTVTATVTAVTDRRTFAATALTQADDWFGEGVLTWLTGGNAGLSVKVKSFAHSGAVLGLASATIATIAVGDTFAVLAGCRKRLDEDCAAKFGNAPNFQGEPHRPTTDDVTATATVDA